MTRVRTERNRFVGFVLEGVESIPAENKLLGYAQFIDAQTLSVRHADGSLTQVHAKSIVIASGSTPNVPSVLEPAGDRVLINDDVFNWKVLNMFWYSAQV